jgi:hypothetical protein
VAVIFDADGRLERFDGLVVEAALVAAPAQIRLDLRRVGLIRGGIAQHRHGLVALLGAAPHGDVVAETAAQQRVLGRLGQQVAQLLFPVRNWRHKEHEMGSGVQPLE